MLPEVAMVIYPHGSLWFWRIEIDGKTVQDCSHGVPTLTLATGNARQAHIDHMNRAMTIAANED